MRRCGGPIGKPAAGPTKSTVQVRSPFGSDGSARSGQIMAKLKRSPLTGRRRLKPRAELFEERVLLSPFVVTNTHDSGTGSLRQAIT